MTPFDSEGHRCGLNVIQSNSKWTDAERASALPVDLTEYKFKYFTIFGSPAPADGGSWSLTQMLTASCVKKCPVKDDQPECKANLGKCPADGLLPKPLLDTKVGMKTYCVPTAADSKKVGKQLFQAMDDQFNVGQYLSDVGDASNGLAIMMLVTLIIAIIYIFLLKWFVKPILYTSMVLILAFLVLLGGWCFMKRSQFDPVSEKKNYQYATIGAIVSWIIAFIYLCFICCCAKNIALGASIMQAASAFVGQNLRVLFLPVIAYVISFVFLMFWILTAVHIYSIGEPEFKSTSPIANIKWDKTTRYAMWFFLFGLFWVVAFIICLQ